jgi:hypothetical protein
MKTFRFIADIEFDADDLDDALKQLAAHFLNGACGIESGLEFMGHINLEPKADSTKPEPTAPVPILIS